MSKDPQKRNKETKETSKGTIDQPEPLDKQDPTEPVKVSGSKESKGASL